jgi:hypothetical protein
MTSQPSYNFLCRITYAAYKHRKPNFKFDDFNFSLRHWTINKPLVMPHLYSTFCHPTSKLSTPPHPYPSLMLLLNSPIKQPVILTCSWSDRKDKIRRQAIRRQRLGYILLYFPSSKFFFLQYTQEPYYQTHYKSSINIYRTDKWANSILTISFAPFNMTITIFLFLKLL